MTDLAVLQSDQLVVSTKVYAKPTIICELRLETRAGSPLGGALIDPLGLDPAQPE